METSIAWSVFAALPLPAALVEPAETEGWRVHRNAPMSHLVGPGSDHLILEWAHADVSLVPVRVRDAAGTWREMRVSRSQSDGRTLVVVGDIPNDGLAEARRHLSALVGHHLRTPLTPIVGFVDLVQRRAQTLNDSQMSEYARALKRNTARLVRTVTRIADLEDLAGHPVTALRPFALEGAIARAVAMTGVGREVALEVADGHQHVAMGDAVHATRALVEILDNAARHGRPPIRIGLAHAHGAVEVRVRDDGPGLPPHLAASVFEPYVQAAGHNHAPTGEGLGLPLARAHCRAMGADVRYDPESGEFVMALVAST